MLPKMHKIYGTATVNTKGQFVLPAESRKQFNIKAGDQLLVIGIDNLLLGLIKIDDIDQAIEHLQSVKKLSDKIPNILKPKDLKDKLDDIGDHIEQLKKYQ